MTGTIVLLVLIGIIISIQTQVIRIFVVISESMVPTLQIGDRIVVDSKIYPVRYDVISLQDPEHPNDPREQLVKRIMAIESDVVEIEGGILYVNGEEQYSQHVTSNSLQWRDIRLRIPEGHIFVLGDNRNESYDSLNFGSVPVENITGVLSFIVWPLDNFGKVPNFNE